MSDKAGRPQVASFAAPPPRESDAAAATAQNAAALAHARRDARDAELAEQLQAAGRGNTQAFDLLRRQRARPIVDLPGEAGEQADEEPGPDALFAHARSGSRLHLALTRLSAHERWVIGLAYFKELTHQQIADCTGLPLGSVKSLIQRGQLKLREHIGNE